MFAFEEPEPVMEDNYYPTADVITIHNINQYTFKKCTDTLILTTAKDKIVTRYSMCYTRAETIQDELLDTITHMHIQNNALTELPALLPPNLKLLNCQSNKLTELPYKLPTGLTELLCNNNNLAKLPDKLPKTITRLECVNNKIERLPAILPPSLKVLYCRKNKLTLLPCLPETLEKITLDGNYGLLKYYPKLLLLGNNTKDIVTYVNKCNSAMFNDAVIKMSYFKEQLCTVCDDE
jgi:Leucine-rich repeat (LRR) protein